jgi:hypothetical protein
VVKILTKEDKILIKNLWESKKYGSRKLIKEFPNKNWSKRGLDDFMRRLRETSTIERTPGSGRPHTAENIDAVEELVQSQEDRPQTHLSTRQIARELRISQTTVVRIIHDDLSLKCLKRRRAQELTAANKDARLQRSGQLLERFSDSDVDFIWFTDEKIFSVSSPSNSQNDRLYVARPLRKKNVSAARLLRTRSTFSQSLMVSVGISKLGCTELISVDPGAKINAQYYRDVLLQKLLPAMECVSGNISSSNKMAPRRIGHGRRLSCCVAEHLTLSHRTCGRLTHRILIR